MAQNHLHVCKGEAFQREENIQRHRGATEQGLLLGGDLEPMSLRIPVTCALLQKVDIM